METYHKEEGDAGCCRRFLNLRPLEAEENGNEHHRQSQNGTTYENNLAPAEPVKEEAGQNAANGKHQVDAKRGCQQTPSPPAPRSTHNPPMI